MVISDCPHSFLLVSFDVIGHILDAPLYGIFAFLQCLLRIMHSIAHGRIVGISAVMISGILVVDNSVPVMHGSAVVFPIRQR